MFDGVSDPPLDSGTMWSTSYPDGTLLYPLLLRNFCFADSLRLTLGIPVVLYVFPSSYLVPPDLYVGLEECLEDLLLEYARGRYDLVFDLYDDDR